MPRRSPIRIPGSGWTSAPARRYIDPTYAAGSTEQAWTQVDSGFPTTSYWKESGDLQVGDCPASISPPGSCNGMGVARSFVAMSIPSTLYTAHIYSSTVYFTEEVAPSCSAREVDLYWTGGIGSGTTWNNQPGRNSEVASANIAYGYPGCDPASVGFGITSLITQAASGKWGNVTMGLAAASESDELGWKQFSHTVTMTTTYDHAPATPTALSTSPASACSGSATRYFNGKIADVQVWPGTALTPTQIAFHGSYYLQNGNTGLCIDDSAQYGLRGYACEVNAPSYANGYQSWIVYVDSAGHWALQNENTGLCIDDSAQYGLREYACNASSYTSGYQQWTTGS